MARTKKPKKAKQLRHTPENPLQIAGNVGRQESYMPALRWRHLPAIWLVRRVPAYRDTASGRSSARFTQMAIGGAGLAALGLGETLQWGIAGACIALTTLFLPVRKHKKDIWLRRIQKKRNPRSREVFVPAELHYDGAKVTIRSAERVWKSLRPEKLSCEVHVGPIARGLALALIPRGKGASKGLSFATQQEVNVRWGTPAQASPLKDKQLAPAFWVGPEDWAVLYETFVAPDEAEIIPPTTPSTQPPSNH